MILTKTWIKTGVGVDKMKIATDSRRHLESKLFTLCCFISLLLLLLLLMMMMMRMMD